MDTFSILKKSISTTVSDVHYSNYLFILLYCLSYSFVLVVSLIIGIFLIANIITYGDSASFIIGIVLATVVFIMTTLFNSYCILLTKAGMLALTGQDSNMKSYVSFDLVITYIVKGFGVGCIKMLFSILISFLFVITALILDFNDDIYGFFMIILFLIIYTIVFLLLTLRFNFVYSLIADGYGVIEAYKTSFRLTRKCYGKLFLLSLLYMFVRCISVIPVAGIVIYYIYIVFLKLVVSAALYLDVKGVKLEHNNIFGVEVPASGWVSNVNSIYDSDTFNSNVINLSKDTIEKTNINSEGEDIIRLSKHE